MSVEQMREAISRVYPNWKWLNRVKKMEDKQVMAIYYKFLNEGVFDILEDKLREDVDKKEGVYILMPKGLGRTEVYKQMSLFDDILRGE